MTVPTDRPRRFYKTVDVAPSDSGWTVRLDGRIARTPARAPLALPTATLGDMLADEWRAQDPVIVLDAMWATRLANTAIDRVASAREAVADEVVRYAGTDVLCYLAESPTVLVEEQRLRWGAVLDWAASHLGVRLQQTQGLTHQPQPREDLERVRRHALALDAFGLAGLAQATALYGSAILALAVQRGVLDGEDAYELSRLDEAFQERQWGVDAEAAARTARLKDESRSVHAWFRALDVAESAVSPR